MLIIEERGLSLIRKAVITARMPEGCLLLRVSTVYKMR